MTPYYISSRITESNAVNALLYIDIIRKFDIIAMSMLSVKPLLHSERCLSEIADVRLGYSFRERLESTPGADIHVIQMKDVDDDGFVHTGSLTQIHKPDWKDTHQVLPNDLIFRARGNNFTVACVGDIFGRVILAAPLMVIRADPNRVDPLYLQWFINHPKTQAALASMSSGTAVRQVSKAALEQLPIDLPPMSTQRAIVQIAQLSAHEAKLTEQLLRARKQLVDAALLHEVQRQS